MRSLADYEDLRRGCRQRKRRGDSVEEILTSGSATLVTPFAPLLVSFAQSLSACDGKYNVSPDAYQARLTELSLLSAREPTPTYPVTDPT